jgi:Putative addiction module component
MNITLPLEKMTIADKMCAMESLWDDLCRHADHVQSPAWHGDILAEREQNIRVGEASFENWDSAKKKIRDSPR